MKATLEPACKAYIAEQIGAMLVSKSWLRQWKTKQCRVSHLMDAAVCPTQSITCVHERLLPEHRTKCASAPE